MRYLEPATLADVLVILTSDEDALCLAGGQTLVAMMNAELVAPSTLVCLRRIADLQGIRRSDDGIRIGAMTTHATLAADNDECSGALQVVRSAAAQIAHPAIRNMGTIGGAICHADPQSDYPAALVAANASVETIGPEGIRTIPINDFFMGYLETALDQSEVVTAITLPDHPDQAVGRHLKFSRVEGDYATVSVSCVLKMEALTCRYARIAIGSVSAVPLHLDTVDEQLNGSILSSEDIVVAGKMLAEHADPIDDVRGSSEYRRMLIPGLLARAITDTVSAI